MIAQEINNKQDQLLKGDISKVYAAIEKHIQSKKQDKFIFWYKGLTNPMIKELEKSNFEVTYMSDPKDGDNFYQISWQAKTVSK